MKKILFSIIGVIIACFFSGFIALVAFGLIEGLAVVINPEDSFQWVAPLVCPDGSLEYREVQESYTRPGETEIKLHCVSAYGERQEVTLKALGYLSVLSYLVCFVPTFIILGVPGFLIPLFISRRSKKQQRLEDQGAQGYSQE